MVEFCGIFPFYFFIKYQCPIFVNVNTMSFIEKIPVKISNLKGRILKIWILRVCNIRIVVYRIRWMRRGILR